MRPAILLLFLSAGLFWAPAQSFTVTVYGGYGGGTFSPGDSIHIFAREMAEDEVFLNWSGYAIPGQEEWYSGFIMPAQDITLTANFDSVNFSLIEDSIMGLNNLKQVFYYFPPNPKGLIMFFHGTGGRAQIFQNQVENSQLIRDAVYQNYAVMLTNAEEITIGDQNGDGKLRWATTPINLAGNVDISNISIILDTLSNRGLIDPLMPKFAVGVSNGAAFSSVLAIVLNLDGSVMYIAGGLAGVFSATTVPNRWCMAQNDTQDGVGAVGNMDAASYDSVMQARGICSEYLNRAPVPLYPERFARIPTVSLTASRLIFDDLKNNGILNSQNYIRFNSDSIFQLVTANPSSFPILSNANPGLLPVVGAQIDVSFSEHKFYSDVNKASLAFLDRFCTVVSQNPPLNPVNEQLKLWPNPGSGKINFQSSHFPASVSVYNLQGKQVLHIAPDQGAMTFTGSQNSSYTGTLDLQELSKGLYIIRFSDLNGKALQKRLILY